MNILITGIHGFVGSNLVAALKQQHTIYGLDIVSPQKDGVVKTFGWNELAAIPPMDGIIHLAGKAHDTKNQTNAQVYFDINTGLTQQLFDWFLTTDARKFIFFSSVKAVADSVEDVLTEDVAPAPKGPYGESKLAAEEYILSLQSQSQNLKPETKKQGEGSKEHGAEGKEQEEENPQHVTRNTQHVTRNSELKSPTSNVQSSKMEPATRIAHPETQNLKPETKKQGEGSKEHGAGSSVQGVETWNLKLETWNLKLRSVYVLRPCMIHGPGNKGNLNLLYQVQQKGLPWPLGAFENKRSFCAVDNLQFVIQQLIEKDIEPGIYQVADDEALSTNELIRIMAGSQNKKARIWRIPSGWIKALVRVGDVLHLPLNSERLKKLTESYVVSNQKLKTALGIERMPVTAEDGLKKTLESFQG